MLAGDFARNLRTLNRNLRIYCSNNNHRPAGIFHVVKGEYTEICGIDKNIVQEHSIMAPNGTHIHGGWRRALRILIQQGLIDRKKAEKLFKTSLHYRGPKKKAKGVNIPKNYFSSR